MEIIEKKNYLFNKVTMLKGVGKKIAKYLKNKKIEKINDLLWRLPYSYTDRSNLVKLNKLEVGAIQTSKVKVCKYQFPRIRNLPNKIICEDEYGKINLVFFNSREGYIRNILPLNEWVIISGKVNFFRNMYQMTNPEYVAKVDKIETVQKVIPKYSLSDGLTEKVYNKIISQVILNIPNFNEWHDNNIIKKLKFFSWRESIEKIHNSYKEKDVNSIHFKRIAFDEIMAHLLVLSQNRRKIKKIKKKSKNFKNKISTIIKKNLGFELTKDQEFVIKQINEDLASKNKMFRILQGDVGSGKTIVSLIAASNAIEANFQCALMAPTEILAKQHFELSKKIFNKTKVKIEFISGKTEYNKKKDIINKLNQGEIDFIIGTHSLFQNKIQFKKLGLIVIDEQHKFGVNQRMQLAKKGGDECDVLLMSATPIPRTMMLAIYGDMDISKITEKPSRRKKIITLSKPEEKINEIFPLIKNQILKDNQVFWVCPLIEESQHLDYTSAKKKYEFLNKKYPNKVGLIHGALDKSEKELILNKFLNKNIKILVSTTVIEVGIDFPNANLIIIENSNKFGLAQLHQLRGRVGRGEKQGMCILLFKGSLSKNAIQRIKILKSSDDGFFIAEEDMRLRGYGDIIGFQQSGIKYFKIADPVNHKDIFKEAEVHIKFLEKNNVNLDKYNLLLKIFDKAEIINNKIN
jgi:ATP-dependent DNA helicase RecG